MELVEGEALSKRMKAGTIPMAEALAFARDIAAALEAAHAKGIVHRDPGNVMISSEGRVKLLDFGLAKSYERDARTKDLSHSPTLTDAGTEAGVILGTVAYMSPEQARGQRVDARTDIWAFGVVLSCLARGALEWLDRAYAQRDAGLSYLMSDPLLAKLRGDPRYVALLKKMNLPVSN